MNITPNKFCLSVINLVIVLSMAACSSSSSSSSGGSTSTPATITAITNYQLPITNYRLPMRVRLNMVLMKPDITRHFLRLKMKMSLRDIRRFTESTSTAYLLIMLKVRSRWVVLKAAYKNLVLSAVLIKW